MKNFLKIAGVFVVAVLLLFAGSLAVFWPQRARLPEGPSPPSTEEKKIQGRDDLLEHLTQVRLHQMQSRLAKALDSPESSSLAGDFRTALIGLSMSRPLAGASQWLLHSLADHRWMRRGLFFAMPAVRWMSEPFLYFVDLSGDAEGQKKGAAELFSFVSARKARGLLVTLDHVGDASHSPQEAKDYLDWYRTVIQRFCESPREEGLYLSLKLSGLMAPSTLEQAVQEEGAAVQHARLEEALTDLLTAAAACSDSTVFLRLDMEEYATKDATLGIFRHLVESKPRLVRRRDGGLRLGVVVQAYLRDSARDIAELARWGRGLNVRVPVRLVKGAYEKHEKKLAGERGLPVGPVWNHKPSTDANYEALTEVLLLQPDVFETAVATHNIRTLARAMAVADAYGLPPGSFELQMLYGMGDPIKGVATDMGFLLREYIPAGSLQRGLTYAGRRFQELAGRDNALSRTLHGDFSVVSGTPFFQGERDLRDGRPTLRLLQEARREREERKTGPASDAALEPSDARER